MSTPIRKALRSASTLHARVCDGAQALGKKHLNSLVEAGIRSDFADSMDLDASLEREHPQDHRWDYLLGHEASDCVVGLEPHSANQGEISRVISKRAKAIEHLADHLRPGVRVAAWYWVASGQVGFLRLEKATRQLQQAGIMFVGRQLRAKHLPVGVNGPKREGREQRDASATTRPGRDRQRR